MGTDTAEVSFSAEVRHQLAGVEVAAPCCREAALLALVGTCGAEDGRTLVIATDAAAIARLAFRLAKDLLGVTPQIQHQVKGGPAHGGGHRHFVAVPLEAAAALSAAPDLPRRIGARACCRRTFLRAAFLGCGSVVNPERAYHLEFATDEGLAAWLESLLDREGLNPGSCPRSGGGVKVYLKSGEAIATLLTLMGAHKATLRLEELRVNRELRNHVQRTVNCETANLTRTVSTAERQMAEVLALRESPQWAGLPGELRETADLRLAHPYASLADLARLHDPPVSKSAVNHRLRRLTDLAAPIAGRPGTGPLHLAVDG